MDLLFDGASELHSGAIDRFRGRFGRWHRIGYRIGCRWFGGGYRSRYGCGSRCGRYDWRILDGEHGQRIVADRDWSRGLNGSPFLDGHGIEEGSGIGVHILDQGRCPGESQNGVAGRDSVSVQTDTAAVA